MIWGILGPLSTYTEDFIWSVCLVKWSSTNLFQSLHGRSQSSQKASEVHVHVGGQAFVLKVSNGFGPKGVNLTPAAAGHRCHWSSRITSGNEQINIFCMNKLKCLWAGHWEWLSLAVKDETCYLPAVALMRWDVSPNRVWLPCPLTDSLWWLRPQDQSDHVQINRSQIPPCDVTPRVGGPA